MSAPFPPFPHTPLWRAHGQIFLRNVHNRSGLKELLCVCFSPRSHHITVPTKGSVSQTPSH